MDILPPLVLTRRPCARLAEGELTHLARASVDLELAAEQHATYRAVAGAAGAELIDVPAAEDFPDSTFVEDVLLAFPECFILCRPGAVSRRAEADLIAEWLPRDRPILRVEAPATVDGGDVLTLGREVFLGVSRRTNVEAVSAIRALLAPFGYAVTPVTVGGALHLKTAITSPAEGMLLANSEWVDLGAFGARRLLHVDPSEPFAANTLRFGDRLLMQSAHPRTAGRLDAEGLKVQLLDISQFAKLEAGLTCMSVVVPRAEGRP